MSHRERFIKFCYEKRITGLDFSEKTGIAQSIFSQYKTGRTKYPSGLFFIEFAIAFGISLDWWLLDRGDEMEYKEPNGYQKIDMTKEPNKQLLEILLENRHLRKEIDRLKTENDNLKDSKK